MPKYCLTSFAVTSNPNPITAKDILAKYREKLDGIRCGSSVLQKASKCSRHTDLREFHHTLGEMRGCLALSIMSEVKSYEPLLGGKTPDFLCVQNNRKPIIVDVVTIHAAASLEKQHDFVSNNFDKRTKHSPVHTACLDMDKECVRLRQRIENKINTYKDFCINRNCDFGVIIVNSFSAAYSSQDISLQMTNSHNGYFYSFPHVKFAIHVDGDLSNMKANLISRT